MATATVTDLPATAGTGRSARRPRRRPLTSVTKELASWTRRVAGEAPAASATNPDTDRPRPAYVSEDSASAAMPQRQSARFEQTPEVVWARSTAQQVEAARTLATRVTGACADAAPDGRAHPRRWHRPECSACAGRQHIAGAAQRVPVERTSADRLQQREHGGQCPFSSRLFSTASCADFSGSHVTARAQG